MHLDESSLSMEMLGSNVVKLWISLSFRHIKPDICYDTVKDYHQDREETENGSVFGLIMND
jgi:hypothetical protein